jgi:hypothetical protein
MSLQNVGYMVRLRYKLMWAKTRSRNGKIALFVVGYLLLAMFLALLAAGGLGAAMIAIKSGKAELVAQAVLGGLFVQALFGSIVMGFGMNAVFSDVELRRYPLTARERRLTRHFIGIVDPFWFLILALELGLAIGLYALGDFSIVLGLGAVLLLFVSNYLLARVVSLAIERMVSRKSGSALLMVGVMCLAFLPGVIMPVLMKSKANVAALLRVLKWTPPFGAAAAMTQPAVHALPGLGLMLWWLLGLAALLVYLEKNPPRTHSAQTTTIKWDSPFDRVGALFGPRNGPLMAFWLRFYARNNRFRALYGLSLPLVAFLTFNFRNGFARHNASLDRIDPNSLFLSALGAIFVVSFFGTSRFAVNQFGYTGGAYRRLLLLPTDPAASLRAGSYTSMLVGSVLIPVALVVWSIFGGPFDARKLVMLLGSAVTGLFALHAAGLWVTLYGPRKGSYTAAMGNDMSLMGNVVVICGMLGALFTPLVLSKVLPAAVSPENWWLVLPLAGASIVFYIISLRATGTLFQTKREELLAVVEGRVN